MVDVAGWTRDELEHTRLGLLDGILEDLLFAAIKPEDDELWVIDITTPRIASSSI
jgi:hypothetical protein